MRVTLFKRAEGLAKFVPGAFADNVGKRVPVSMAGHPDAEAIITRVTMDVDGRAVWIDLDMDYGSPIAEAIRAGAIGATVPLTGHALNVRSWEVEREEVEGRRRAEGMNDQIEDDQI